jgi:hypothetical protein
MSLLDSLDELETPTGNADTVLDMGQIPVVFLSFDEPNADENYEHLRRYHPNPSLIHRVHGVKGFDAAHKAAADAANSMRFFTVDADCRVDKSIWYKHLEITSDVSAATFSWSSRNIVNGLVYGNGGIKLWFSSYVKNMRSHEAAAAGDERNNIDFCWDFENYRQMNNTYGTVVNNASEYQAFRAGFREGIKMGLDQGYKVKVDEFNHKMYPANYSRWLTWMTVGRDVEHGVWCIYGARLAAHMLYLENFDHTKVANYDWFAGFWKTVWRKTQQGKFVEDRAHDLLIKLREALGLPLAELDAAQSEWFKHVNICPPKGSNWPQLLNHSALPLYGFTLPKY